MADTDNSRRVIEAELAQVRVRVPPISGVKLEAAVPELVRIYIYVTEYRQVTLHVMFPVNYPLQPVILELKSKKLSDKVLDGLGRLCDDEAKRNIGQRQVVMIVNFVKTFLEENPLCVCNDEITYIKRKLLAEDDKLILKQKTSQIVIKLKEGNYFMNLRIAVPQEYPIKQVMCEIEECNFPLLLRTYFQAQAVEIARQCVMAPLKKKPKDPPFEPRPSLRPVCDFIIQECAHRYPRDICQLCLERILPDDPQATIKEPRLRLERVYCSHLFHNGCLDKYMKTPPFIGGKKCPACGNQIFHDKWRMSPELAEARWAHKQARQRELDEVVDFLE